MKIKVSFNLETEEVRKLINLDPNAESLEEIIQGIIRLIPNECPEAPEIAKMSFYESVSKRIDEEFPDKCEIRDYLVDNLQERYGHMENWEDYERLKQYAILHFKKDEEPLKLEGELAELYNCEWPDDYNEQDADSDTEDFLKNSSGSISESQKQFLENQKIFFEHQKERSENETPEETGKRIFENAMYKFKYAYGLTEEEIKKIINHPQELPVEIIDKMSLEIGWKRGDIIKDSIEKGWEKTDNIPMFIVEEILLIYLNMEFAVIADEKGFWDKFAAMARALSSRINSFEFDSENDNRHNHFYDFMQGLLCGTCIDDEIIESLIEQIPYKVQLNYHLYLFFNFAEAQEAYIKEYGKKSLSDNEINIRNLTVLPNKLEEIKKVFVYTGRGYKPYCEDDEKFSKALDIINTNLNERTKAGLTNDNNAIPSGACPAIPKKTDFEIIKANLLMMPKYYSKQNIEKALKIFDFKEKKTIIRHLIKDLNLSQKIAEELCTFKA